MCFFRHYKGVTCPGSDNYPRYRKSRETEDDSLFRVGKQIIKSYLEGIYFPLHATIWDGYTSKLPILSDKISHRQLNWRRRSCVEKGIIFLSKLVLIIPSTSSTEEVKNQSQYLTKDELEQIISNKKQDLSTVDAVHTASIQVSSRNVRRRY